MSNWGSASIIQAAEAVREAMRENLRSEFALAKVLKKLKSALDDGEFVRFLMDCDSGLAIAQSTAYKFERMVSAVDVIPAGKVWEKIGWEGVGRVVKIETHNERVAVCRAIARTPAPITKHTLLEILADKAPSYSAQRGSRSRSGGITKTQAIHDREILVTTLSKLLEDYAVLRRDLSEEVVAILGLDGDQTQKAG